MGPRCNPGASGSVKGSGAKLPTPGQGSALAGCARASLGFVLRSQEVMACEDEMRSQTSAETILENNVLVGPIVSMVAEIRISLCQSIKCEIGPIYEYFI